MKVYLTIANLVLITVGAYVGVNIAYRQAGAGLEPIPVIRQTTLSQPESSPPPPSSFARYRAIARRNLFRTRLSVGTSTGALDINSLEQTNLNLKLYGTVTGNDSEAYAVIEDRTERRQDLYRVGDEIQGATVKMILRGKVVLSLKGDDEVLEMAETIEPSPGPAAAPQPAQPSGTTQRQQLVIQRSALASVIENPSSLATHGQLRPTLLKGRPAGYKLIGVHANSVYRKLGLENGDILKSINGTPLKPGDGAAELYRQLRDAGSLTLEVRRRGKMKTLDYRIE